MRFQTALCLATLFLFCFTIAAWSTPNPERFVAGPLQPTPDNQSLSGTIASVGDASFTVEVRKNQNPSTVQFQIDGNTKVEGKLAVGSLAAVEYRTEEGRNVAIRVTVTSASGMSLY